MIRQDQLTQGGTSGGGYSITTTSSTSNDSGSSYSAEEDIKTASGSDLVSATVDYVNDKQGNAKKDTTADVDADQSGGTRAWDTDNDNVTDVITGGHDMDSSTDEEGVHTTQTETVTTDNTVNNTAEQAAKNKASEMTDGAISNGEAESGGKAVLVAVVAFVLALIGGT
jgi:hypothetical protein